MLNETVKPTGKKRLARSLYLTNRKGWLQLASGELSVGPHKLFAGDGLAMSEEKSPEVRVDKDAHFLFFDLPG